MKSHLKIFFLLIIVSAFSSCNPDEFFLNNISRDYISVYKVSGIHDAVQTDDNSIIIKRNALVSICKNELTRQNIKFYLIYSGECNFNIYLRTTWKYLGKEPKVKINFADNGIRITDGDIKNEVFSDFKMQKGIKYYINFIQDGKKLKFQLNCADIFNVETKIPMTEYSIFETGKDTELEISGITIDESDY